MQLVADDVSGAGNALFQGEAFRKARFFAEILATLAAKGHPKNRSHAAMRAVFVREFSAARRPDCF